MPAEPAHHEEAESRGRDLSGVSVERDFDYAWVSRPAPRYARREGKHAPASAAPKAQPPIAPPGR